MNKYLQQKNKSAQGFTIIEVVLVLAIAALIFLMVFIALPALQRGQRDTGRKNDVSTVVSALQTYLSNNRGSFAAGIDTAKFVKYLDRLSQYEVADVIVYPSGSSAIAATDKLVHVYIGQKCPISIPAPGVYTPTLVGAGTRQAAVVTLLENNGTSTTEQLFCQEL